MEEEYNFASICIYVYTVLQGHLLTFLIILQLNLCSSKAVSTLVLSTFPSIEEVANRKAQQNPATIFPSPKYA